MKLFISAEALNIILFQDAQRAFFNVNLNYMVVERFLFNWSIFEKYAVKQKLRMLV